jgi:methyl-accepting chemotaxis protein
MRDISTASREQSQGIEQINTTILEMNRVTQQNAASAEELAAIMAIFITDDSQNRGGPSHGRGKHLIAPR